MEELMKEIPTLFCRGPTIKESQVFVSTFQQLLMTNRSECRTAKTRCWATPQRWLLTLDTPSLCAALWNPVTQKKVELPSMEKDLPKNCKCLLSCQPISPGCVVLVVDADEPVIWYCCVGGNEWTRHEYEITVEKTWLPHMLSKRYYKQERAQLTSPEETSSEYILKGCCSGKRTRVLKDGHGSTAVDDRFERFQIQSIAAVEGKFYFDISSSKLGVLEFVANPVFTTIEFERLRVAWNCWELASPHLVESRGRLFLVMTQNTLSSIALYKMDFSRLAWSSVDGLYDQVFFLGRLCFTAAYSAWELGLRQSNVYYLGEDGMLNVFFPGDKYKPCSTYCHRSMDNLPAPLLSIYNVLTKACGFTIGSS